MKRRKRKREKCGVRWSGRMEMVLFGWGGERQKRKGEVAQMKEIHINICSFNLYLYIYKRIYLVFIILFLILLFNK